MAYPSTSIGRNADAFRSTLNARLLAKASRQSIDTPTPSVDAGQRVDDRGPAHTTLGRSSPGSPSSPAGRERRCQVVTDLLRAPLQTQFPLDHRCQFRMVELACLGSPATQLGPLVRRIGRVLSPTVGRWPLRLSSRLTVSGDRPICPAISRTPAPASCRSAICNRSSRLRYRPDGSGFLRGTCPPVVTPTTAGSSVHPDSVAGRDQRRPLGHQPPKLGLLVDQFLLRPHPQHLTSAGVLQRPTEPAIRLQVSSSRRARSPCGTQPRAASFMPLWGWPTPEIASGDGDFLVRARRGPGWRAA